MANDYANISQTGFSTDVGTYAYKVCLPIKINCFPTCNIFLKDHIDLWNCNVCKASDKYMNPYIEGETLMFETRFFDTYNTNPDAPTSGWGSFMKAEILDLGGNVIYNNYADFASDYLVGHNGVYSYQILSIDTSLINIDNFSIRIYASNLSATMTEELFSEPYRKALTNEKLIYIESTYTNEDCCGNYYGLPTDSDAWIGSNLIQFSNRTLVPAQLKRDVGEVRYDKFNYTVKESTFSKPYTFKLTKPIPLYLSDWILNIVMAGQEKTINEIEVYVDDLSPSNEIEKGDLVFYSFTVYTECTTDFFCG